MTTLTELLMLPIAIFSFIGTIWYGYNTVSHLSQTGALGLVIIAIFVSIISEIGFAGISIVVNEVLI